VFEAPNLGQAAMMEDIERLGGPGGEGADAGRDEEAGIAARGQGAGGIEEIEEAGTPGGVERSFRFEEKEGLGFDPVEIEGGGGGAGRGQQLGAMGGRHLHGALQYH